MLSKKSTVFNMNRAGKMITEITQEIKNAEILSHEMSSALTQTYASSYDKSFKDYSLWKIRCKHFFENKKGKIIHPGYYSAFAHADGVSDLADIVYTEGRVVYQGMKDYYKNEEGNLVVGDETIKQMIAASIGLEKKKDGLIALLKDLKGPNKGFDRKESVEEIRLKSLGIKIRGDEILRNDILKEKLNLTDQKLLYFLYYRFLDNPDECFKVNKIAQEIKKKAGNIKNRITMINKKIGNIIYPNKNKGIIFIKNESNRGYHLNPTYMIVTKK